MISDIFQLKILWYAMFLIFLGIFVYILKTEKKSRFFFYFVFGTLFGFIIFDLPSTYYGYYTYPSQYYIFMMLNLVPLSMALMEGFAITITIYLFEKFPKIIKLIK